MARCWRLIPASSMRGENSTNYKSSTSPRSKACGPTVSRCKDIFSRTDWKHRLVPAKSIAPCAKPTCQCPRGRCLPGNRCAIRSFRRAGLPLISSAFINRLYEVGSGQRVFWTVREEARKFWHYGTSHKAVYIGEPDTAEAIQFP